MSDRNFFRQISDRNKVITPIDNTMRFPEALSILIEKYDKAIDVFCQLIRDSESSGDVLRKIRTAKRPASERMALLKMYRRCIAPVLDTETTKQIRNVSTDDLIANYGDTFKTMPKLKSQFSELPQEHKYALAALVGEYDTRGQQGYELTGLFFDWFEDHFAGLYTIEGPRGAGRDIELSEIYPDFQGSYPCDFVVRRQNDQEVVAVGFARYDSTRGGAQSDDRTGGNSNKVEKAKAFDLVTPTRLKLIFLSDGPGLIHGDTWEEACSLDGQWDGRVRVVTLKLAQKRITTDWLEG